MQWQHTVTAADIEFSIAVHVSRAVDISVEVQPIDDLKDTVLIHVRMQSDNGQGFYIRSFSVDWSIPAVDMHGLYFGGNPRSELSYLPFWNFQKYSCANTGLPYMSLIHRDGENRIAFGLLDQLTETHLTANLSELTRCYHVQFQKPANQALSGQQIPVTDGWEEVLFVSRAKKPWPEVLNRYTQMVDTVTHPALLPVPDHAFDPVFCTWTAIHHAVSHKWIMRQAATATELGFRTWLTDDGWFIEKGQFGDYRFAGDWQPHPAKFPDLKTHVQAVKALGFRYVLWVAPFMVGNESRAARDYPHLLIDGQERNNFMNLSPWHTETADIISNLIERLVRDYELDGLKIDFIDSIRITTDRHNGAGEHTLGESIYRVLKQAIDRARESKPDLLVEFRNSYANLASRSYANLYRSSDVPLNFTLNRWQAVMLRLLVPDRAVHLDPALWHPQDTDENVAVHLINCLVSVPMVSIELDQYPPSHLQLIRHWIGFYNTHRQTFVHGQFKPVLGLGHVPAVYFRTASETIIGVYDDVPVSAEFSTPRTWILNASTRTYVTFSDTVSQGDFEVIARDKFGNIISSQQVSFPQTHIDIEIGGSLELLAQ